MVVPTFWCSRLISTRIWVRSFASRFDRGSSNRNTSGCRTMARPIATRWRWPPDNWPACGPEAGSATGFRRLGHRFRVSACGRLAIVQRESQGFAHCHVGVKRVVLEHTMLMLRSRGGRSLTSRPADQDAAARDILEPRDHPQRGGLAAAEGPTSTTNSPCAMSRLIACTTGSASIILHDVPQDHVCHVLSFHAAEGEAGDEVFCTRKVRISAGMIINTASAHMPPQLRVNCEVKSIRPTAWSWSSTTASAGWPARIRSSCQEGEDASAGDACPGTGIRPSKRPASGAAVDLGRFGQFLWHLPEEPSISQMVKGTFKAT